MKKNLYKIIERIIFDDKTEEIYVSWDRLPWYVQLERFVTDLVMLFLVFYALCQLMIIRPEEFPFVFKNDNYQSVVVCNQFAPMINQATTCFENNGSPSINCFYGIASYNWSSLTHTIGNASDSKDSSNRSRA